MTGRLARGGADVRSLAALAATVVCVIGVVVVTFVLAAILAGALAG